MASSRTCFKISALALLLESIVVDDDSSQLPPTIDHSLLLETSELISRLLLLVAVVLASVGCEEEKIDSEMDCTEAEFLNNCTTVSLLLGPNTLFRSAIRRAALNECPPSSKKSLLSLRLPIGLS